MDVLTSTTTNNITTYALTDNAWILMNEFIATPLFVISVLTMLLVSGWVILSIKR
jgi:hypothetical protein